MADISLQLEHPAPQGCRAVRDLYAWSGRFDGGKKPFALFLDLIGWTEDEFGEGSIYDYQHRSLGDVERGKLGAALTEYVEAPDDVRAYVRHLVAAALCWPTSSTNRRRSAPSARSVGRRRPARHFVDEARDLILEFRDLGRGSRRHDRVSSEARVGGLVDVGGPRAEETGHRTREETEHRDPGNHDHDSVDATCSCLGHDVSVPHRGQGHDRPPQRVAERLELRVGRVLGAIGHRGPTMTTPTATRATAPSRSNNRRAPLVAITTRATRANRIRTTNFPVAGPEDEEPRCGENDDDQVETPEPGAEIVSSRRSRTTRSTRNTSHAAMKTTAVSNGCAPPGNRNSGRTAETISGNAIRWSKRASASASAADRAWPGCPVRSLSVTNRS